MNNWKTLVENGFGDATTVHRQMKAEVTGLKQAMNEVKGAMMMQATDISNVEKKAKDDLTAVAAQGREMLEKTVSDAQAEFGRQSWMQGVTQGGLQQVVQAAEGKFGEIETNTKVLIDSFPELLVR